MAPDLSPDAGFLHFGANSLLAQLQALTQESNGVRQAQDIECVHRMRVASRRLRTRLCIFASLLPQKKAAEWEKEIRRLTKALAVARDTDVQLDFLRHFQESHPAPPLQPGIKRLCFRLQQRRKKQQARVVKAVDRLEKKGVIQEMERTLRHLRFSHQEPTAPSAVAYRFAREEILARFAEMESFEIYLPLPERKKELHQMRIAAKHFRYAMEVFAEWYPGELKSPLHAVRKLQELLGELHDCDVWLSELPRFLEQERELALEYFGNTRPVSRLKAGIAALVADRQETRDKRYQEVVEFWEKTRRRGVWRELAETLAAAVPAEPPPPSLPEEIT